jgi:hypothetical protein
MFRAAAARHAWQSSGDESLPMQTPRREAPPRDRTAEPSGAATEGSAARRWARLAPLSFLELDAVPDEPLPPQSSRRKRPSPSTTCSTNAPAPGGGATRKRKARKRAAERTWPGLLILNAGREDGGRH